MSSDELLRSLVKQVEQARREILELRFAVERLSAPPAATSDPDRSEVYAHHHTSFPESHHFFSESYSGGMSPEYSHHRSQSGGHLAIWIYRDGSWDLDPTSLPEGISPGAPPNIRGDYDGQHVKTTAG